MKKNHQILFTVLIVMLILFTGCTQKQSNDDISGITQDIFVCSLGTKMVKTDSNPRCIELEGEELEQYCKNYSSHMPIFLFCQKESDLKKVYLNSEFQIKIYETVFLESKNEKIRLSNIFNSTKVKIESLDDDGRFFIVNQTLNERAYMGSYYMTLLRVDISEQIATFYLEEIPKNPNVTEEAVPIEKNFVPPNFVPQEDWAIKYVELFKQAIKEKYNIDDETLDKNLMIVSVKKGTKSNAIIHYIYKINWALFNGYGDNNGISFIV